LVVGQSYIDVSFDTTQPNASWLMVECDVSNIIDPAPLNIWTGLVTSRTTTGFRVQLNGIPDSGNYYLTWAVVIAAAPSLPA
jgi:hypothetical protein